MLRGGVAGCGDVTARGEVVGGGDVGRDVAGRGDVAGHAHVAGCGDVGRAEQPLARRGQAQGNNCEEDNPHHAMLSRALLSGYFMHVVSRQPVIVMVFCTFRARP